MTNININKQIQILINQFNTKNYSHVILKSIQLIKTNTYNIVLYNLLVNTKKPIYYNVFLVTYLQHV